MCALVGSGTSASAATSDSALKQAALTYASATLSGPVARLDAVLSPECRSSDHVVSEVLPIARSMWASLMGISLSRIRTTGVRVRDLTATSAQAEVEYNTPKAGNDNWVTYVLDKGHWLVGGQCATPVGNSQSSFSSSGTGGGLESALKKLQKQAPQLPVNALLQEMNQDGIANTAAASAASAAEELSTRNGVPLQALSTTYLNARLPAVTWVGVSKETPYTPTGKRIVGINVLGGHVVTAMQPYQGQCNFGLVVTSPSDPIIVTEHLAGPGTYGWNYLGPAASDCSVASAPKSWLSVTPPPLSSLAHLQRPTSGCRTSKSGNSTTQECSIQGKATTP
jgi:hypothetical protein